MSVNKMGDISMLGYLMIRPSWLKQLPAYHSDNARVVRACLNLLTEAINSSRCGELVATVPSLAVLTGLTEQEVLNNFKILTGGWEFKKETKTSAAKITFAPIVELGKRLSENFQEELNCLQAKAGIALASPDLFETSGLDTQGRDLLSNIGEKSKDKALEQSTNTRRRLPDNAPLYEWAANAMNNIGIVNRDAQLEVWEIFCDICYSSAVKSANWAGRFRMFLRNEEQGSLLKFMPSSLGASDALGSLSKLAGTKMHIETRGYQTQAQKRKQNNMAELDKVNRMLNGSGL